jgi:hypothetical protein
MKYILKGIITAIKVILEGGSPGYVRIMPTTRMIKYPMNSWTERCLVLQAAVHLFMKVGLFQRGLSLSLAEDYVSERVTPSRLHVSFCLRFSGGYSTKTGADRAADICPQRWGGWGRREKTIPQICSLTFSPTYP